MKGGQPVLVGSMNINILMYANDILLLSKSRLDMQRNVDACHTYFSKWKLELSVTFHGIQVPRE